MQHLIKKCGFRRYCTQINIGLINNLSSNFSCNLHRTKKKHARLPLKFNNDKALSQNCDKSLYLFFFFLSQCSEVSKQEKCAMFADIPVSQHDVGFVYECLVCGKDEFATSEVGRLENKTNKHEF